MSKKYFESPHENSFDLFLINSLFSWKSHSNFGFFDKKRIEDDESAAVKLELERTWSGWRFFATLLRSSPSRSLIKLSRRLSQINQRIASILRTSSL